MPKFSFLDESCKAIKVYSKLSRSLFAITAKKLLVGLLIGSIVGAGAIYCYRATRSPQVPLLKKVEQTIAEVGEMLESSKLASNSSSVVKSVEKNLSNGSDIVNGLMDWLDTGLALWKKFK